jgi:peroxiredoxin
MVVEDGTVKSLAIEENPGEVDVSGADKLVASL